MFGDSIIDCRHACAHGPRSPHGPRRPSGAHPGRRAPLHPRGAALPAGRCADLPSGRQRRPALRAALGPRRLPPQGALRPGAAGSARGAAPQGGALPDQPQFRHGPGAALRAVPGGHCGSGARRLPRALLHRQGAPQDHGRPGAGAGGGALPEPRRSLSGALDAGAAAQRAHHARAERPAECRLVCNAQAFFEKRALRRHGDRPLLRKQPLRGAGGSLCRVAAGAPEDASGARRSPLCAGARQPLPLAGPAGGSRLHGGIPPERGPSLPRRRRGRHDGARPPAPEPACTSA